MEVILSKNAQKQYNRLPEIERKKVKKKLTLLQNDENLGKKLTGEFAGIRSLRAWPYRILYEINETEDRIEVHQIKHRQGAYK